MADSKTNNSVKVGLVAEYATPGDLMHAAEKFRDAGYKKWDVYSPFPVHGMDEAMGLGNSKVGWFTFLGGLTGYTSGMLMIWWMNAYDYALGVGGKPRPEPVRRVAHRPSLRRRRGLPLRDDRRSHVRTQGLRCSAA